MSGLLPQTSVVGTRPRHSWRRGAASDHQGKALGGSLLKGESQHSQDVAQFKLREVPWTTAAHQLTSSPETQERHQLPLILGMEPCHRASRVST